VSTAREDGIQKLYHYQGPCLKHLRDTLAGSHIHCSNPENFNDPWDCRPYFDVASANDPVEGPKWIPFVKQWCGELSTEQQENILRELGPRWYENPKLLLKTVEKITPSVYKNNAQRYRIFCLTPHANSLLMWSHYAEKHKGLCLEFDATQEKLWRARRVIYSDTFPKVNADMLRNPTALLEAIVLTKSREWEYEKEYRLLGRDGGIDPNFSLATDDDFMPLPKDAITAVIAGSRANLEAIREIVQSCAPGVPVKWAVQRPHEYHLDIFDDGVA
jgi:hypothetical protein